MAKAKPKPKAKTKALPRLLTWRVLSNGTEVTEIGDQMEVLGGVLYISERGDVTRAYASGAWSTVTLVDDADEV